MIEFCKSSENTNDYDQSRYLNCAGIVPSIVYRDNAPETTAKGVSATASRMIRELLNICKLQNPIVIAMQGSGMDWPQFYMIRGHTSTLQSPSVHVKLDEFTRHGEDDSLTDVGHPVGGPFQIVRCPKQVI